MTTDTPSASIAGYLIWRATAKGKATPSKLLIDHRTFALNNPNHQEREHCLNNLLREVPLNEHEWRMSLGDLARRYPPPPPQKA